LFSKECEGSIVGVACDIIDDHRNGRSVSLELVRSLINSLKMMDKADADYEKSRNKGRPGFYPRPVQIKSTSSTLISQMGQEIMKRTKDFYQKEGSRLVAMSPGDAVKYVYDVCEKEKNLFSTYLSDLNVKTVDSTLNETVIVDHLDFFLQGFESVVVSNNIELGKSFFAIFRRVNKLKRLADRYAEIVKNHVEKAFEKDEEAASKDCRKYIEVGTGEYTFFHRFGKECFADNVDFDDAFNKSMIATINDNAVVRKNIPTSGNKELSKNVYAARVFSQYIFLMMMPGKEHLTDESEAAFIKLYKLLKSKRDFLEQYKNGLCQRLLRHETVGIDFETQFLNELKKVKPEDILSQCTNMINDVLKVGDQAKAFQEFVKSRGVSKCPVEPLLCSSAWPIKLTSQSLQMPPNYEAFVKLFSEYFNTFINTDGKKSVTIMHQYGRCDVVFHAKGVYDLSGTELHLIVLPMIKNTGTISFKQIMDATGIPLEDLKSQLAFLINNSFVLVKNEESMPKIDRKDRNTWLEGTLMKANAKFVQEKKKFTISVKKSERSTGAAAVTKEDVKVVFENYKLCSEANVVRIMKTRKDFSVNELYSETMKAVSRWFSMNRDIFRASLEDLIDQEIIKRIEGDKVQYIA